VESEVCAGNTILAKLETDARETKAGLWRDQNSLPS